MHNKKEPLLLAAIQALYWAGYCTFYTFIVLYLKSNGLSDFLCGFVMTLLSLTNFVIQPIIGYITDTYISCKSFLCICFSIAAGVTFLIPYSVSMGNVVILAIVFLAIFDYSEYCLIDAWIISLKRTKSYIDFPSIRSFGSMGYAITALIFGNVINKFGYDVMFYAHAAILVITVLIMLLIPASPCLNKVDKSQRANVHKTSMLEAFKTLIKIKPYMIFLLSVALYQFGMRAPNTYLPMFITAVGGNSSDYGMAVFIASILEAGCMFAISRLVRHHIPTIYIYSAGLVITVIRLITLGWGIDLGLGFIMLTQIFQAIGTATYLCSFMDYISKTTPDYLMSTAATLGTALTAGVGCILGNFIAGVLIESVGLQSYCYICAGVMMLSFIVSLPLVAIARQNEKYIISLDVDIDE